MFDTTYLTEDTHRFYEIHSIIRYAQSPQLIKQHANIVEELLDTIQILNPNPSIITWVNFDF
jgi:hypothetical protein